MGVEKGETYGKEGGRRGGSVSDGKVRLLVPKYGEGRRNKANHSRTVAHTSASSHILRLSTTAFFFL